MAWVAGQRGPDRSGESWCEVVRHWPCVERVITDAGKGQEHAPAIAIEMGLDVFHTQRELQRVVHRKWKQVEPQVEATAQADHKVEQSTQRGRDARGVAPQAWRAWRKAEWLFDEAVQAASAAARIETALAVFQPEGGLHDRQWAQGQLHAAMQLLTGPEWGKVRRLLSDTRALKHLDWVQEQLIQIVEGHMWREAFARLWSLRETMTHTHGGKRVRLAQLTALEQAVCQRLWPEWQSAYARVHERLRRVVRASSAVECLNSVVRMHQARHRHVSQGMLDLKRLYWNCRAFRHGKRKEACPYELLGLQLPPSGWWTLLQMDPKELEHKLFTQKVRGVRQSQKTMVPAPGPLTVLASHRACLAKQWATKWRQRQARRRAP